MELGDIYYISSYSYTMGTRGILEENTHYPRAQTKDWVFVPIYPVVTMV